MASPQIENGYLKIANELMMALVKIRIPGEARQVFDAILRQTYGFHKKNDQIATMRFMELTGLSRRAIHRARRKLLKMNLISVSQKGYSKGLTYSIQKDYHKWQVLPKKDTVPQKGYRCIPKRIQGVSQKGHEVYPKKRHTKDIKILLKDTNIKDKGFEFLKDEVFKNTFQDYLNMRQKIRKPATDRAWELALIELHKYDIKSAIAMLEQSIMNSWQGIFPLKKGGSYGTDKNNSRKGSEYAGVETEIKT